MESETQCSMPHWVRDELARREAQARYNYANMRGWNAITSALISEAEYVQRWLKHMDEVDPLTWTTSGSQEAPAR